MTLCNFLDVSLDGVLQGGVLVVLLDSFPKKHTALPFREHGFHRRQNQLFPRVIHLPPASPAPAHGSCLGGPFGLRISVLPPSAHAAPRETQVGFVMTKNGGVIAARDSIVTSAARTLLVRVVGR